MTPLRPCHLAPCDSPTPSMSWLGPWPIRLVRRWIAEFEESVARRSVVPRPGHTMTRWFARKDWEDRTPRVLIVSHEASRTGAPRVAILAARALRDHGHHVSVVSRLPGPLLDEFAAVCETSVEPLHRVRRRLRETRSTSVLGRAVDTMVAWWSIARARPDVVYVNSTAAVGYVRPARWLRRRVVLHAHESAAVARPFFVAAHVSADMDNVELVACSPSVQRDLAAISGRRVEAIRLIPSVPDSEAVRQLAAEPLTLEVSDGDLVIGCCGAVEHRKGADLWVQAARLVLAARQDRRLRFVWVGNIGEPVDVRPGEPIEFVGPRANPYPLIRRFDIGTLPSRDDPFPLVVLESMLLGVPVVAFGVGGVPDQVGDVGIVVSPTDVEAFADAIVSVIDDEALRRRLGSSAPLRVAELFSVGAFAEAVQAAVAGDTLACSAEPRSPGAG